jgi:zinc transporter ZupT
MAIFATILFLFLAPFLGGQFGLKFKDRLHLTLGFSAGTVAGLAFFELIPESAHMLEKFGIGGEFLHPTLVLSGIIIYMLLDRVIGIHKHSHDENDEHEHSHEDNHSHEKFSGKFKAATFSFHSFIDGLAVGLAFQVSVFLGIATAIAVIAHSFSDGLNTAIACQKAGMEPRETKRWILTDAISPVIGMLIGLVVSLPESALGLVLAVVSGFFVYVSMTDLVPESFHAHPTKWTTVSTILGIVFIAVVVSITHQFVG